MGYVTREMIDRAKEMDLLTYLQTYEPQELVHFGGNTYCTREHDSLKISNGKWCWFSRGIGGKTAPDYLIKVKELPFTEAVERIVGRAAERPSVFHARAQPEKPKTLLLPPKSNSSTRVIAYLKSRGIDGGLIEQCIRSGQLYESLPYHNAVFVGKEQEVNIRELSAKRRVLQNALRTKAVRDSPKQADAHRAQIRELSERLKALRREVHLCDDIAKRYGVVYCVLREAKDNPHGVSEIMVRAEDAAKINRIVENIKIATVSDPEVIRENAETGQDKNKDAVIPATVRPAEISTADKSIFRHEPRGRAAATYGAPVKEVERIGEKQRIRDADITR